MDGGIAMCEQDRRSKWLFATNLIAKIPASMRVPTRAYRHVMEQWRSRAFRRIPCSRTTGLPPVVGVPEIDLLPTIDEDLGGGIAKSP